MHGSWYAIPHGSQLIEDLNETYEVQGIPRLVVVRKDGGVVSMNARLELQKKGVAYLKEICE